MDYAKESLRLHEEWKGKIRVDSAVPVKTMQDLSLAYTPGVTGRYSNQLNYRCT